MNEKEAGDEAWKAGNFEIAIEHYSRAIISEENKTNVDKNILLKLYSNRSASYLKLKKNAAALLDGNKCVEINPQWSKGLIRKGDALYALSRYTDAYNAYNSAARIDPNDQSTASKLAQAERAIRDSASSSSSSSTRSTPSRSSGNFSLQRFQNYFRLIVVLGVFLYLLPFGKLSFTFYRTAVISAAASYIITLYGLYGLPKFNMEYAQRLMADPTTMYLFLSILLAMTKPYLLAVAPVYLTEFAHLAVHIAEYAKSKQPALLGKASHYIDLYLPSILGLNQTQQDWKKFSERQKWQQFNTTIVRLAVTSEVLQGIFLAIELLLPTRNFIMLVLWWQYLQMRYMTDTSGNMRMVFIGLDTQITTVLANRYCPELIRQGYTMLRTQLQKRVQLPQPGQPAPSMMPKCSIM